MGEIRQVFKSPLQKFPNLSSFLPESCEKVGDPTARTRRGTDSMSKFASSTKYPNCENSVSPKREEMIDLFSRLTMSTRPLHFLK